MKGILKTCTYRKQFALLCCTLLSFIVATAQNPIVTENALPGNPPTEWDITGAGDLSIQGFATDISVNKGNTVHFKIQTDATDYTIDIYRIGYYNGDGARKVGTGVITATLPQNQPDPLEDTATGLVDCGNWSESAHWDVPSNAVSGVYIAKLTRTDNSGASHIVFIVRDDASTAPIFFQTSDATWQAYNVYGGNSLYVGTTSFPAGHAAKVSYNRPFVTRNGGGGGGALEDWLFNAEYPTIRFLERNGYDISYTTNVDAARSGNLILNHQVYLSVGHDEYWSAEQRNSVEAARNAGVHLAFFSGNEVYWKTRWENSTDGTNTAFRTLVCYKEGTSGESVCGSKCDPSPEWTGLWRSGCNFPSAGGCLPENALSGQISWDGTTGAIVVPAKYKNLRFWRNTSITSLTSESEATFPMGTLGYEWDWEQFPASNPPGRITMSSTTLNGHTHKLSLYKHSSGALVFGAGTVQWAWGLDSLHDGGNLPADPRMQQATVNLFADMGVQPATLQSNLVAATASTDNTAPQTTITNPIDGVNIVAGTLTTISGTSTDAGGVVAGIEISLDGGATWTKASGTSNWTYSWTPTVTGTYVIKVRGIDDSGNIEAAGTAPAANAISVSIIDAICPCSVFKLTDIPQTTNIFDNIAGIEVGMKFKSTASGFITGIRFYKSTNDTGTHIGTLWSADGSTILGQVTFTNETASGWQQAAFGAPIAITAGTTYVISYNSPTGYYAETSGYFAGDDINSPPLVGLSTTGTDGANGVFTYANTPTFPTSDFGAGNYWVDVVFNNTVGPDTTPPVVTSTSPVNFATQVDINKIVQVQFNEFIDLSTVNNSTFELRNSSNTLVPATVQAAQTSAVLTPTSLLTHSVTYTATLKGGASGIKDLAGNALSSDYSWSFTVNDPPPLPPTDGPGGPILVITSATNPFSAYAVEILRAEGMNEFASKDISQVDATLLNNYDVVILGEMSIDASQATMFTDWVNAGGTFIAFRPAATLSTLLGITSTGNTLSEGYILVNTTAGTPGAGIVGQTMQYHGVADEYTLNGATSIALLYSDATTATTFPAVTTNAVGSNGGKAIAFTYSLAKSIVYTRQGNPAWAGQKRDGTTGPIRSDDLFFGTGGSPDYVDFNKIAIPQADEQQRLLINIISLGNLHRKPLPRFWYLPSKHKAAIVMTGDDHDFGGTTGQFNHFMTLGPNTPQDVADWKAIRGTSYIYNGTLTNQEASDFQAQGFEIALHLTTNCSDYTPVTLENNLSTQLSLFASVYPDVATPVTNRTHCIAWSDWAGTPKLEVGHGIRLDANYYYWPAAWVQNRPGLFTGSGMPMRFADLDGTMIDCYQLTTQMTDESEIDYTSFANALLDRAQGPEGYYGVFTANMHTDSSVHTGANAIIASALAHQVPVVSAKQMLTWLDGRNGSSFGNIVWNESQLSFSITALSAANNIQGMLPFNSDTSQLVSITNNGNNVTFSTETIKGVVYAFFTAASGNYVATYGEVATGTINGTVVLQGRPAAPNVQWQEPVQVDIYANGNNTTPAYTYNVNTDQNGNFTVANIPVGSYTIAVKNSHSLKRVKTGQAVAAGNNPIDFGTLLEGDANDDNTVDIFDFSLLVNTLNKSLGDPGFDARADFNQDGTVDIFDFSLLVNSLNQFGETP